MIYQFIRIFWQRSPTPVGVLTVYVIPGGANILRNNMYICSYDKKKETTHTNNNNINVNNNNKCEQQ